MYDSIQHFNEFGVKKIEKTVKNFISEGKDIADLVLDLEKNLFELGRNILKEVLEDMDEYLRACELRKKNWEIVRKDDTSLLTSFGKIEYSRTYFKPKRSGKRKHLVDEYVGIKAHDRVSADVVINAVDEAIDSSYRKGGKRATLLDDISKQAVMNKIHEIEICEPEYDVDKKKEIKILYIEADEDHVSQQQRSNRKVYQEKKIIMPRLVYVHEGIDYEKSTRKRKVLKNIHSFGGVYNSSEELWLEVAKYIEAHYEVNKIETIYLSGDGAAWIKQGLNWIPKSKFVLDKYHLAKYVKKATAHLNDEAITQGVYDALEWADRDMLIKVFDKIFELTESEKKIKKVKDAKRYMLNNWNGISISADKGYEIIGCSAEGHVSHIFSNRLSSRPKGWSKIGVTKMSKLLIYKSNGGKVYDLIMAQKIKQEKKEKEKIQDNLIKELRKSSSKYVSVWDNNLTAIDKGHKTGLYVELRKRVGLK